MGIQLRAYYVKFGHILDLAIFTGRYGAFLFWNRTASFAHNFVASALAPCISVLIKLTPDFLKTKSQFELKPQENPFSSTFI
jgi:hypothetical protein